MRKAVLAMLSAALCLPAADPTPVRILVAYHSVSGNTEKIAQAVKEGMAKVPGATPVLRKFADVTDEEILAADGVVVGTPVYWSNVTPETRSFVDRFGNVLFAAKKNGDGRTAGAFCTAGGTSMGKEVARLSIISAFLTQRFVIVGGMDPEGFGTMGPAPTTGVDDPGISDKELAEARVYGERFARLTRQLRSGQR